MRIIEAHRDSGEKQLSSMRWIKMIVHNKKDEGEKKTRSPKGREVPHLVSHFHKSFFPKMLYGSHLFSNSPGHLPCNSQSFLFQLPIADLFFGLLFFWISTPNRCPDISICFLDSYSDFLANISAYRQIFRKLIYFSITCPDISYMEGLQSKFMHSPHEIHWHPTLCFLFI